MWVLKRWIPQARVRWRRPLKPLLLLLFAWVTVMVHFELQGTGLQGGAPYLPWLANETLGHPKTPPQPLHLVLNPQVQPPGRGSGEVVGGGGGGGTGRDKRNVPGNQGDKGSKSATRQLNSSVIVSDKTKGGGVGKAFQKLASKGTHAGAPKASYNNRLLKNDNSDPAKVEAPKPRQAAGAPKVIKLSPKRIVASKSVISHDVDTSEISLTEEDIARIQQQQARINEQQQVYNLAKYGPVLANTSILLVQVHNRLENLRYLVEGMTKVKGIDEAVVVFSHDFWDTAINAFVRNITEFRVMQMFFPFSIQLHPHAFPGRDPRDCKWNVNNRHAAQCLNRAWPDSYGHYREASFTQIKHHWWWKIHRVFEGLSITRGNYTGHVVFLEEDHYVSPDLLHVLHVLRRDRHAHCPTCQVLALGNYNKMAASVYKNFRGDCNKVERGDWWVTKNNLGFALDVDAWRIIASCKEQFCNFDDYNWDWTLNNLVHTCCKPKLAMLAVRFSRVIHVGSCGTHVKKRSCDVKREVQVAVNRFSAGKQYLFPAAMVLQNHYRGAARSKKGNGGWGDLRDKQLCRAIANGTASDNTIARLQFPEL